MWKAVKGNLNWIEGGPPSALTDKVGKLITKPKSIAERYHDVIREKVENISKEMEKWREDENTEEIELKRIGMTTKEKEFQFRKITEEELKVVISNLLRKTSSGTDYISYIEIKDGTYYV